MLLYAYLADVPNILTDAQYFQSSASSRALYCIVEPNNRLSPTKLKLQRLSKPTNYKIINDDSESVEHLSGEDSDNYVPSISESSSEDESAKQSTDLQTTVSPNKKGKKDQKYPEQWKQTKSNS